MTGAAADDDADLILLADFVGNEDAALGFFAFIHVDVLFVRLGVAFDHFVYDVVGIIE